MQLVVPPPQRGTMAAGLGRSLSEAAAEGGEDRKRKQSQKKGFLGFFFYTDTNGLAGKFQCAETT